METSSYINVTQCTRTLTCKYALSIKFVLFIKIPIFGDTLIRNTHRTFTDIWEKKIQLRQFYNFIISKILRRYYFFSSPLEDVFIGDNMSIPGSHNGQLVIITLDDKCAWAYMCMCVCVWVKIAWNTITTLTKDQCLVKSWRVHAYTTVIILDHFLFFVYFIITRGW